MDLLAQISGWIGAGFIVLAYLFVSSKKIKADSRKYQLMNLLGAVGVGINTAYEKAWPSFALQAVWCLIAILALVKSLRTVHASRGTEN